VVGFSRLRRRGRIDASRRASLTLRVGTMLPRVNVYARHYQYDEPASVLPCEVLQPDLRPLLALRAGNDRPARAGGRARRRRQRHIPHHTGRAPNTGGLRFVRGLRSIAQTYVLILVFPERESDVHGRIADGRDQMLDQTAHSDDGVFAARRKP
jgi:hypothetical protein